jgi:hypothetical protein
MALWNYILEKRISKMATLDQLNIAVAALQSADTANTKRITDLTGQVTTLTAQLTAMQTNAIPDSVISTLTQVTTDLTPPAAS